MNERRPDPDALLRMLKDEEKTVDTGVLKIFLGMCAGVGKTYAMLEAAQRAKDAGIDVVIGVVETHGRWETEKLLDGLEVIPRKSVEHRGSSHADMDVDAILARRPQLVLVDELAHTNPTGWRHRRRFQDIDELLDNGINVFSTLNVQHLESRADDVERITGVSVRERVPDSVLAKASDVEVVDITPAELLQRLSEGKVYAKDRSIVALQNFFRKGNLVALREMALRTTAERVDTDLRTYRQRYGIEEMWPSAQSYLVAIGPTPHASRLVRWTCKVAQEHGARWVAAIVRRPGALSDTQERYLQTAVSLVEELGGELEWIDDDDIVNGLLTLAHRRNAVTIVVGKPRRGGLFSFVTGAGIVSRLIARADGIDVSVVATENEDTGEVKPRTSATYPFLIQSGPLAYVLTIATAVVMIGIGLLLLPSIGYQAVGMIFLLYVSILPVLAPRGPVLVTAVLTAGAWDLLFIPPRFTLTIGRLEDQLTFTLYFITALTSTFLATRIRRREEVIRRREQRTEQLYALATEANASSSVTDIVDAIVHRTAELINADVAILVRPEGDADLDVLTYGSYVPDAKEHAVAMWVYDHARSAGCGTETLPFATARYMPMSVDDRCVGVIGFRPRTSKKRSFEDPGVIERIVRQAAWSFERMRLNDRVSRVRQAEESERLSRTILNAVSHELRTPMASILGSASTLEEVLGDNLSIDQRQLVHDMRISAERLDEIVTDLLDMARIDAGKVDVKRQQIDIRETLDVIFSEFLPLKDGRTLFVEIDPPSPPDIGTDATIIRQVVRNLVGNAIDHTPEGTSVSVTVAVRETVMTIIIDDDGPGISTTEIGRIFDRFARGPRSTGSGLGLSIVRGLVEALNGRIVAGRSPMGGARFTVTVPLAPN
ncbi:MAG TPA: sensor histidine kinase KdpD [Candidatus Didemnitutus sp.]|nr:sensor histidine kinase KdpD [Candidatus Didemnitutus sp.]